MRLYKVILILSLLFGFSINSLAEQKYTPTNKKPEMSGAVNIASWGLSYSKGNIYRTNALLMGNIGLGMLLSQNRYSNSKFDYLLEHLSFNFGFGPVTISNSEGDYIQYSVLPFGLSIPVIYGKWYKISMNSNFYHFGEYDYKTSTKVPKAVENTLQFDLPLVSLVMGHRQQYGKFRIGHSGKQHSYTEANFTGPFIELNFGLMSPIHYNRSITKISEDQRNEIIDAVKYVLSENAEIKVKMESSTHNPEDEYLIISGDLIKGVYYDTKDELERLVRERCAAILKSVLEHSRIHKFDGMIIEVYQDIPVYEYGGMNDSFLYSEYMLLYRTKIKVDVLNKHNITVMPNDQVADLMEVSENIIPNPNLKIRRVGSNMPYYLK